MKNQKYIGEIIGFNEEKRFVESIVLHFDTPNENLWMAKSGSLDAFLERLSNSNKGISACYQHNDDVLIGVWKDFRVEDGKFIAKLYLSDTPFVNETVITQLKDGTLQGSSPTIAPLNDSFNKEFGVYEIFEGVLCEISLVGLPADLEANIIQMKASINKIKENDDFELELLF